MARTVRTLVVITCMWFKITDQSNPYLGEKSNIWVYEKHHFLSPTCSFHAHGLGEVMLFSCSFVNLNYTEFETNFIFMIHKSHHHPHF